MDINYNRQFAIFVVVAGCHNTRAPRPISSVCRSTKLGYSRNQTLVVIICLSAVGYKMIAFSIAIENK